MPESEASTTFENIYFTKEQPLSVDYKQLKGNCFALLVDFKLISGLAS